MGFFEALSILTALGTVLLAFAAAGILRMVRTAEYRLNQLQNAGVAAIVPNEALRSLRPPDGKLFSAVLVVSPGCGTCDEVIPIFVDGRSALADTAELVVVSWDEADIPDLISDVRRVLDTKVYRSVEPGWTPAFVLVDRDGQKVATEPVGSPDAMRHMLSRVASMGAATDAG